MSRNLDHSFRGRKLLLSGFVEEGIRVVLTTPDTLTENDNLVAVNLTVAGAVALTLPSTVGVGTRLRIYDQKGDAGTNNITISPPGGVTIEGAASLVINVNNGALDLILESATNWKILSRSYISGASADLTSVSGNLGFTKEAAHSISIATSTTATTVGGALSIAAGAGATTGTGGAASLTGGAGGNDGVGGAASIVGGAAGGGNRAGGAASVTGGAGAGSAAGGAVASTGGAGGATGAGGAASLTGGAGGATSGTGGAVAIAGGAGSAGNANGGAVTINGGAKNGAGSDGAINIGTTRGAINIGTTGSLIGMNGVTAAAIPTPAGYSTMQTAGATTSIYTNTATTGGVGSTQFTFGDLVASLKTNGFIKQ